MVVALVLLLSASRPQEASDVRAIEALVRGIIEADNAGDVTAVMGFYAADALLVPPGGEPVEGRDAIEAHYSRLFARFSLQASIHPVETAASGDLAFQRGTTKVESTSKATGERSFSEDRYVMILKRVDGGWRIWRLIWNRGSDER